MSMDFPRAWQIARATSMEAHEELCSYRAYCGGLLCDCYVITSHPEFLDDVLQTVDGVRFGPPRTGRPAASHSHRQPLGPQRIREGKPSPLKGVHPINRRGGGHGWPFFADVSLA